MRLSSIVVLSAACLAACAAPPLGPMVQVLPAPGKPFDQFAAEDDQCRAFASSQVAGQAEYANNRAVGGAVLSTVLGAGLGAAVGGGRGAAVGAATGAGIGAGLGAGSTGAAQGGIQYQYDAAYAQCMYSHGNQVPGYAPAPAAYAPPGYYPPPPPGYAPGYAPPPGAYAPQPIGGGGIVRATQVELIRLGYLRAPADGVAGPDTVAAIESFQQRHGMPVDGQASAPLLDRLSEMPSR